MLIPPALPWGAGGDEELWQGSVRLEVKAGSKPRRSAPSTAWPDPRPVTT